MKKIIIFNKILNLSINKIIRRNLLIKECSPNINLTTAEARKLLQNIVGSPKFFGESSDPHVFEKSVPKSQSELPERSMLDSYREVVVPLGRDRHHREKYLYSENTVRYGRFFEDLDTMAVLIGYSHNQDPSLGPTQKSQISIVTAMVDSLKIHADKISYCKDIYIRGHVTWVGGSSMEVSMSMDQDIDGSFGQIIGAKFLMVARDPVTKKKAFVNPLLINTAEEKNLFDIGLANKEARSLQLQTSLSKNAPSESERMLMHDLFMSTMDVKSGNLNNVTAPPNTIWMSDAGLKNIITCYPQQRNLYNKIFGGYLMRKALELARANATVHCKNTVKLQYVDDISFKQPVEIGCLLYLSSRIVYTVKNHLQLRVHAQVLNPLTNDLYTSNYFQLTFVSDKPFPSVVPRTYAEYILYLEGKRHLENHI